MKLSSKEDTVFKLKITKGDSDEIRRRLHLVETPRYDYVLTDNKDDVEVGKINIVFPLSEVDKVSGLLDLIVKGEEVYINGYNKYGQKLMESSEIQYFIVEDEEVFAVLSNTRLIVKMKLYEIEELLKMKNFIRVSKYCLVNIRKIEYIRTLLNSKLELKMMNDDLCEVNRRYLKGFKSSLNL
jgi:DNA-binding LytR/AlgR family response regulator